MKYYKATFTFFSEKKLQCKSREKKLFEQIKSILSSDSRFIQVWDELCAISSIQSVRFSEDEMQIVLYDDLCDDDRNSYDKDPASLMCEVVKSITNS